MPRLPSPSTRQLSRRPRLETLEDRCLLSAGDLDPTFGNGGLVVTDVSPGTDFAYDLAVQADGKLLAVGYANGDFGLARYNPNGTLDPSFGGDGLVSTDFGGQRTDRANAVILQPDGKVVAVGSSNVRKGFSDDWQLALARYLPNGSLDGSFGKNGKVNTDLGSGVGDAISAVALQSDGKIVVAGVTNSYPGTNNFLVARYTAAGKLDSTFGSGGVVYTDFGGFDSAAALVIQGDGKLVVVGKSQSGDVIQMALARYNPNGSLDSGFGVGGKMTALIGPYTWATDVKLQTDGRIVVAGSAGSDFLAARYLPDGSLDPTFDGDGVATVPDVPEGIFDANAMALQPDGKIVLVGLSVGIDDDRDFGLVRLDGDGSLDATFGGVGWVRTDFNPGASVDFDIPWAAGIQADGKIVLAGVTYIGSGTGRFALARYEGDAPLRMAAGRTSQEAAISSRGPESPAAELGAPQLTDLDLIATSLVLEQLAKRKP